jgi:hypothetical protein
MGMEGTFRLFGKLMFANASPGICLVRLLFFVVKIEYPSSFFFNKCFVLFSDLGWYGKLGFLFCLAQSGCLCFAIVF